MGDAMSDGDNRKYDVVAKRAAEEQKIEKLRATCRAIEELTAELAEYDGLVQAKRDRLAELKASLLR